MAIRRPRPLPGYPTTWALYPVSVRRIRVGGIGFLQIPPRDGHPCLALRFGPSPPAEDLHLLRHNMPGAQKKTPRGKLSAFCVNWSGAVIPLPSRKLRGRDPLRNNTLFREFRKSWHCKSMPIPSPSRWWFYERDPIGDIRSPIYRIQNTYTRCSTAEPSVSHIRSNTSPQSPARRCRNNRIAGYHGLSARSSSQRQHECMGRATHTGTPRAPAK